MKLVNKITLYTTLSKIVIVVLFIWLLPGFVKDLASQHSNYNLKQQKKMVLENIRKNGINYYFEGDSSYGSYTMLKEEYISLQPAIGNLHMDTISTAKRIVENDTLTYRLLDYVFEYNHKNYLLEIGKTTDTINEYNKPIQRVALYALAGLIAITLIFDLLFTHLLLRPLKQIIRTKLNDRKTLFKEKGVVVKTTTTDFRLLDQSLIDLMEKIREAFEKEKEFTSNASHELMTPIGILQNKMENLVAEEDISDSLREKISGMMNTLSML